jgi:hypothetical protein
MMRSRTLYGGHPNPIVVADDIRIVEHRGNAGRPHTAAKPSRTFIQRGSSSLRCKPNTLSNTDLNATYPNPRAPKEVLDTHTSTGNDGAEVSPYAGGVTFAIGRTGFPEAGAVLRVERQRPGNVCSREARTCAAPAASSSSVE